MTKAIEFGTQVHENEKYFVIVVEDALGEGGRRRESGYGCFNKETGVREFTTLSLPQAIWNADMSARMLADNKVVISDDAIIADVELDPTIN